MKCMVKNLIGATDYVFVTGGTQLSDCVPMFEVDKEYNATIDYTLYATDHGALSVELTVTIYTGSVDGYDAQTGVRFYGVEQANRYFTFSDW